MVTAYFKWCWPRKRFLMTVDFRKDLYSYTTKDKKKSYSNTMTIESTKPREARTKQSKENRREVRQNVNVTEQNLKHIRTLVL